MGPDVIAILATFLTPVLITSMVLRYRLKRRLAEAASRNEIEALRREIADLRLDLQSRLADLTLMVDDAMAHVVAGAAKRPLGRPEDEEHR